jgi:alkylation response protein AidB-like acyl-CoA dehydrogenase
MNFAFTMDQEMYRDTVEKFAKKELAPEAIKRASDPAFPWDVARRMSELGVMGIAIPEADGGMGGTLTDSILALQAVAENCPRSGDVIQAGNFGPVRTLAEYGTPAQKERFLAPVLKGRALVSLAMTEPDAGSAVSDLKTAAAADGGNFIVNGTKIFGTHSCDANVFLVYVRFGPGIEGIGSVLLEKGTPGFSIGQPSGFMNGESWSQLYFDNVRVPSENVVLGPGGFRKQLAAFNIERLGNAARSVALGRHAFNLAREYASHRKQFGRELREFQGVQWKFAEMAVRLEAAQLLLLRAASHLENGLPSAQDTAMAKLACNEAGYFSANEAVQIMGGMGFSRESTAEYCLRRTRGWMIAGGSLEILKNRIAEGVFNRRFSQRPS